MVLPSSGSLTYNTIRAEFGSPSSNVYLNLYYRGGPYTYQVPRNSSITTSSTGQLSASNFYGAAGKGDYAAGPFGYYSTGGKLPNVYAGCGGPSLPSMSDTSIRTNVFSPSMTKSFVSLEAALPRAFTMGPFASGNNNQSRTFYFYNTSGTLQRQFTWKSSVNTGSNADTLANSAEPAPTTTFASGTPAAGNNIYDSSTYWDFSNALIIIRGF